MMGASLLGLFFLLLGSSLVFFSDLVELLDVLMEFGMSLKGNEKFGFLAFTSVSLHLDGFGSDLLELGILVSMV